MIIKKKITNLIGATILGSVILASVITTIFLVIFDKEQKSGESSADYRTINSFTEKARSLILLFDIATIGTEDDLIILQLLIEDGLTSTFDQFDLVKQSPRLADMYDLSHIEIDLQTLKSAAESALSDKSLQDELSKSSSIFSEDLDKMDALASAFAQQDRARIAFTKKISYFIAGLTVLIYISIILYVRSKTVKEIVDPIVKLSNSAHNAVTSGEKINLASEGPQEVRKLITSVQSFANEMQRLVDQQTASLANANDELEEKAAIAKKLANESQELAKQANIANEAKGQFLANMSHEIRTPMNGILGMLTILEDLELNDEAKELVDIAKQSASSLLRIINDILDFSKIEAGAIELEQISFNLSEIAYEAMDVIAMDAHQKDVELITQISNEIPQAITGDSLRLRQIFLNLLGNALKFTKTGFIKLSANVVSIETEGIRIRFEVEDSGLGIPPEKLKYLFDAFSQVDSSTTRNYGGTGLGLSICKQLVALMDGQIGVSSISGHGSIFWFETSLNLTEIATEKANTLHESLVGTHSVIIGGQPLIADFLKTQMHAKKIDTTVVNDPFKAFSVIKKIRKKGIHIDNILFDTKNIKIDSNALAKELKTIVSKKTKMVALTNFGNTKKNFPEFKASIARPIKEIHLLNTLEDLKDTSKAASRSKQISDSIRKLDRSIKILVAEDNITNQKVIRLLLKRIGLECVIADDGIQAVNALKEASFDLILMDCQMPVMDGFSAAREIRNSLTHYKSVPIVALTANALKGYEDKCYASGMDDFITKPINPKDLFTTIEKWTVNGPN